MRFYPSRGWPFPRDLRPIAGKSFALFWGLFLSTSSEAPPWSGWIEDIIELCFGKTFFFLLRDIYEAECATELFFLSLGAPRSFE